MSLSKDYQLPLISVLMAVYNEKDNYLDLAIKSVLNQKYDNFEFVIVNDASRQSTKTLLEKWASLDCRIKLYNLPFNIGLTKALNFGLIKSEGKFIARHDSDDYSLSNRLYTQFAYLENNEFVDAVGSFATIIDSEGLIKGQFIYELNKEKLLKANHLVHGSMMFRREVFKVLGGYDERLFFSQDYGLYLNMLFKHNMDIHILPDFLYNLRQHSDSISSKKKLIQLYYSTLAKYTLKKDNRIMKVEVIISCVYDFIFIHYLFLGGFIKAIFKSK
jgi:glycosyltransferase involved in cell wall biosynthesis